MKISICIPSNGQREDMLREAIRSILDQTYQDFEIIVKYNGPASLPCYNGRVKYILCPDTGIFDGMNQAMAHATGDVMCFMGDDDLLAPEALYLVDLAFNTHELLRSKDAPKWAYGAVEYIGKGGGPIGVTVADTHITKHELKRGNCLATPAVFWNRAMGEKVGGFRTEFEVADYDMWLRMFDVTNPVCIHRTLGYYRMWSGTFSSRTLDATDRYVRKVKRAHGIEVTN